MSEETLGLLQKMLHRSLHAEAEPLKLPWLLASQHGHAECVQALRRAKGANVNQINAQSGDWRLEVSEETLGPKHSSTMTAMGNLAATLHSLGRQAEAESSYPCTCAGFGTMRLGRCPKDMVWGRAPPVPGSRGPGGEPGPHKHPDTLMAQGNLAMTLRNARC